MNREQEFHQKLTQLRSILYNRKLDGLAVSLQCNFAWATCGGSNYVGIAAEMGVAHLVVTDTRCAVVCENIEAPRIADEELPQLGCDVISVSWWEGGVASAIEAFIGSTNWASDAGAFGKPSIDADIQPLRMVLCDAELNRYRELGRMVSSSMMTACQSVSPGMSEHQTASLLNRELLNYGIVPQVTLIAADDRIAKYRHPIPSDNKIGSTVMLVTGARKWGLAISMTRLVHFGSLPAELRRRHDAVCSVDAAFISNTVDGASIAQVFQAGIDAYKQAGFDGEWQMHHQGGPTGYKAREFRGYLTHPGTVKLHEAYAWNPSIAGTKGEDTFIVTASGPEVISAIDGWPLCPTATLARPDILIR